LPVQASNSCFAVQEMHEVEASKLGIEAMTFGIKQAADIAAAFEAFNGRVDALYVVGDPLTNNRVRINIDRKVPTR
jgi:ABC-type uncharacterized transport system substrate-binding protein